MKQGHHNITPTIQLKRAYEPPASSDGKRILVERLWPRGISKANAALDGWVKDLAPSTELRKWYNHQPERWDEFQEKYKAELRQNANALAELYHLCEHSKITFIYAASDEQRNSALVLKRFLEDTYAKTIPASR